MKIPFLVGGVLMVATAAFCESATLLSDDTISALAQEVSGSSAKRNLEELSRQHRMRGSDGYHIASLGPSETRPERIYDCLDGCLVEVTDIDGHVLCAFTLNEELADSIGHEMIVSGTSPPSILCDQSSTP